jgi:16S rRNA (adenine1518-N6/adenine1519-N6)-dimethyltransferase
MIEPSIFDNLGNYASIDRKDVILDIGGGLGFLTRFLAERCKRVLTVEADDRLVGVLREQLEGSSNVEIIKGNVLKVQVPEFNKVVSIPPYQISSRLLLWLFHRDLDRVVLIFQKEFASRLVAPVGSEEYGWLTVLSYYYVECELLDEVPREMFYPQPEVSSVIVRLNPKPQPPFTLQDEAMFSKLIQSLFTQRNRKVRNATLPFLEGICAKTAEDAIRIADTLPLRDRRVRELAPEDFGALANALTN